MLDKFIRWIKPYPRIHLFFLTFIFFGLFFGWVILLMPFHIIDGFKKDFRDYFEGIKYIWEERND
jgi:hypothetical protein